MNKQEGEETQNRKETTSFIPQAVLSFYWYQKYAHNSPKQQYITEHKVKFVAKNYAPSV